MSVNEKVITIKQVISLVCEILPQIVSLVKEIVVAIKELQTV